MFEGLKKKLSGITKKLGKSVESASVTTEVEADSSLLKAPAAPSIPEPVVLRLKLYLLFPQKNQWNVLQRPLVSLEN